MLREERGKPVQVALLDEVVDGAELDAEEGVHGGVLQREGLGQERREQVIQLLLPLLLPMFVPTPS